MGGRVSQLKTFLGEPLDLGEETSRQYTRVQAELTRCHLNVAIACTVRIIKVGDGEGQCMLSLALFIVTSSAMYCTCIL